MKREAEEEEVVASKVGAPMSEEEEHPLKAEGREPGLAGPLISVALMGVGSVLAAIAGIWLVMR